MADLFGTKFSIATARDNRGHTNCAPRSSEDINLTTRQSYGRQTLEETMAHSAYLLSLSSAGQLVWNIPADVGFLYDKAAVFGEGIKERLCI